MTAGLLSLTLRVSDAKIYRGHDYAENQTENDGPRSLQLATTQCEVSRNGEAESGLFTYDNPSKHIQSSSLNPSREPEAREAIQG